MDNDVCCPDTCTENDMLGQTDEVKHIGAPKNVIPILYPHKTESNRLYWT